MADSDHWRKAFAYAVIVVVAAISYTLAERSINSHEATLPVREYIDCLNKLAAYDWNNFPGEKPSSSAVCENLASRETVD